MICGNVNKFSEQYAKFMEIINTDKVLFGLTADSFEDDREILRKFLQNHKDNLKIFIDKMFLFDIIRPKHRMAIAALLTYLKNIFPREINVFVEQQNHNFFLYKFLKEPSKFYSTEHFSVYDQDTLQYIIMNDDLQRLHRFVSDILPLSINHVISITNTPPAYVNNEQTITIVDLSIFYGSYKCLSYFLLNDEKISDNAFMYAMASGDKDVIVLLETKGIRFDDCLTLCIRYHHSHLYDWLLLNYKCEQVSYIDCMTWYNFEMLLYLIHKKADLNERYDKDYTLLHFACKYNNYPLVQFLCINRININAITTKGKNPLHIACSEGCMEIVKYLIEEENVNINCTDNDNWTPLHCACRIKSNPLFELYWDSKYNQFHTNRMLSYSDDSELDYPDGNFSPLPLIEYLCNHGAKAQERTKLGKSPLHIATSIDCLPTMRYLIEVIGLSVEDEDVDGWRPLHYACRSGDIDIVRYLIEERRAQVNVTTQRLRTPVHIAAQYSNLNVVKYLVSEINMSTNDEDVDGWLPIHYAVKANAFDLMVFLHEKDPKSIYKVTKNGRNVLHIAAEIGSEEIVHYVLSIDESLKDVPDNDGWTPLHYAAYNGNNSVVSFLIFKHHADQKLKTNQGNTPLHLACKQGYGETANILYSEGNLDINSKNHNNETPYQIAVNNKHFMIVNSLKKYRTMMNMKTPPH